MSKSKIEWTEFSWNVTTGCTRVSSGCNSCYAAAMTKRLANIEATKEKYSGLINEGKNHFNGKIKLHPEELEKPLHWQKPRMVFVNSMSDLFHPDVPFDFVDQVFAVMALAKEHTFQVLTKRPDRMEEYLNDPNRDLRIIGEVDAIKPDEIHEGGWLTYPLPNVIGMTSVEDQERANERIPHLLRCELAHRGLSCEPLLGPVDLTNIPVDGGNVCSLRGAKPAYSPIDWVIVGGESGPNARPMHPAWARSLRDQCQEAGVSFFFKQWGAWAPYLENDWHYNEDVHAMCSICGDWDNDFDERFCDCDTTRYSTIMKASKKKAGRLLDCREWNQMPEVAR